MGFLSWAPDDETFNQNRSNYAILPSSPHCVSFQVVFSETTFQIYYLNWVFVFGYDAKDNKPKVSSYPSTKKHQGELVTLNGPNI